MHLLIVSPALFHNPVSIKRKQSHIRRKNVICVWHGHQVQRCLRLVNSIGSFITRTRSPCGDLKVCSESDYFMESEIPHLENNVGFSGQGKNALIKAIDKWFKTQNSCFLSGRGAVSSIFITDCFLSSKIN